MHIGINLLYLIPGKTGGTETYVKNLMRCLFKLDTVNTFSIYLSDEAYQSYAEFEGKAKIVLIKNIFKNKIKRIIYEQLMMPKRIIKDRIDLLFSPGYVVPVFVSCKQVVTVHDLLYKRYPHTIPKFKMLYWSIFIPLSFLRSSKIIAVSEFVRTEFETYFPSQKNKYIVSYESVNREVFFPEPQSSKVLKKYALPDAYIVCVATLSPHKNLETVLNAVSILKQRNIFVNVVFVGNKERSTQYLSSLIKHNGLEKQIYITGFVPDEDLRAIYSNARVFIMSSLYEGFGLPILESMACGCPVISSNSASLTEVAGSAAEYFSPLSVIELSQKIERVYFDKKLQNELRQKGYSNISRFSWEKTAEITMEIFESALKK